MVRETSRRAVPVVLVLLTVLVAGCAGDTGGAPGMHVNQGSARLASLLRGQGITPGARSESAPSLRSAWAAFKRFAAIPVDQSELRDEPLNDALLFDFGISDFGTKWGRTFYVTFIRQLSTADGDLQQIALDVHFAPKAFSAIRRHVRATPCGQAQDCPARCSFGHARVIGAPCVLAPASGAAAVPTGPVLAAATTWSFDTGGSDADEQRASWIAFVERSPVFREAANRLKPRGYEVAQYSAE